MPLKNGKEFNSEILKKNLLSIDKIFKLFPKKNNITFIVDGKDEYTYNRKEFYNALDILSEEYKW